MEFEFVAKNDEINIIDPIINLTNENELSNKLFYFSEIKGNNRDINLYLDKLQITTNLNFDCLFPSDSKIDKIYISNNEYPFYKSEVITTGDEMTISYIKQTFYIIIDNSNFNIFSNIRKFKIKAN